MWRKNERKIIFICLHFNHIFRVMTQATGKEMADQNLLRQDTVNNVDTKKQIIMKYCKQTDEQPRQVDFQILDINKKYSREDNIKLYDHSKFN